MKNLKIKALFINHFEKMIFGVFALILLLVLGRTTWSRAPETPEQLNENIKKVRESINSAANVWPDKDQYQVVDFTDEARKLFSPISLDHYHLSVPLFFPLNQVDEPRREPIFLPVQSLTAKAGLVTLSVRLAPEATPEETQSSTPETVASTEDLEFKSRLASNTPGAPQTTPAAAATKAAAKGKLFGNLEDDEIAFMKKRGLGAGKDGGSAAIPALKASGLGARGVRVIAVRGVFPLKQQIENYAKALHVPEWEVARSFEIDNLVLERQVARRGPNPWKDSKWEAVDIEYDMAVLEEASEIDREDPVPQGMRDPVITMDLPARLIGVWGDMGTHERIKDELLKEDDLQKQNALLDSLDQIAGEAKLNDQTKSRRKGLSRVQTDIRGLVGQVRGNAQVSKRMSDNMKRDERTGRIIDGPENQFDKQLDRLVANKNYLLFRYLDFNVQSDYAYRYRVRLELRNPNHEVAPELLGGADPAIANGETRETPWSNTSDAAVVPPTMDYFLENVGRDPYRDPKLRPSDSNPVAQFSIFDWNPSLGTVVANETQAPVNILNIGAFIGDDKIEEKKPAAKKDDKDKKWNPNEDAVRNSGSFGSKDEKKEKRALKKNELKILDLSEGGIVTKKHFFQTLDVLIDVEPDAEIDPTEHKELKFVMEKASGGASKVNLLEEALVSTSLGELKTLDNASKSAEKDRWRDRLTRERANYSEIQSAEERAAEQKRAADDGQRPGRRGRRFRGQRPRETT